FLPPPPLRVCATDLIPIFGIGGTLVVGTGGWGWGQGARLTVLLGRNRRAAYNRIRDYNDFVFDCR
ncbi:MAG TPA: hypothetical protein VFW73_08245, partial [Lacipirellulaceae bacterium]|nr:hypothetical protein [Lacipirellulaceae bacterium]